ncbi:MAG TPA: 6,7-dimethyl-8-ribityllumazine synthase [Candidatus Sulfotelmatobacter sp.]|nr:6,7-dimethyl-8-ribityllumazine synthase [Candidatus Sulfotelmatobacter sp.]
MEVHAGKLEASGMRFGIVVARFNDLVSQRLLEGAVDVLVRHGVKEEDVSVAWVPGSFEIPVVARQFAEAGAVDGVICLGTLIRGETPHFDVIASAVTQGITSVATSTGVPTTFGVITAENLEQAMNRAGGKQGNKGAEAAMAAVETVSLLRSLRRPRSVRRGAS